MRGVHLKRKLKYIKKAGVAAICIAAWLLHCNRYVRQYYSEHFNRDVLVTITSKIKSRNVLFKEKYA